MSFTVRPLDKKPGLLAVWAGRVAAVLTVARPLFQYYNVWKKKRASEKRLSTLKKILTVLIAVLAALLLLGGVVKALMSLGGVSVTEVIGAAGTPPPVDEHGFTNILLLGQGDAGHDGKDLTDTVMVASIDAKETGSVALISLPRDLYFLSTQKMGAGRLNAFYRDYKSYLRFKEGMEEPVASLEAMKELSAELGRALGITIHHAVKVDFIGFVQGVDALGGIDVEVPYDIEDLEYPNETYGFEPFIVKAGLRHFDGETALKYARSRHTTSDFGRSARQQQLISLLAHKAREDGVFKDPGQMTALYRIVSEHSQTTMDLRGILGLATLADKIDREKIFTMQLNDRNGLFDGFVEPGGFLYNPPRDLFEGASVLLPVSIPEFPVTWKQIQTLLRLFSEHRSLYASQPKIAVLNAGAPSGSARKLSAELIRYGFNVERIENAESGKRDDSLILIPTQPDMATEFFVKLLSLPKSPAPDTLPLEQQSQVTILLGKDFAYKPLQDLLKNLDQASTP